MKDISQLVWLGIALFMALSVLATLAPMLFTKRDKPNHPIFFHEDRETWRD